MQNQQEAELVRLFGQVSIRSDRETIIAMVGRIAARQPKVRPSLRLVSGGNTAIDVANFFTADSGIHDDIPPIRR